MNMWHVPARRFAAASARVAVEQIARFVRDHDLADPAVVEVQARGGGRIPTDRNRPNEPGAEHPHDDGAITAEYLTACVRRLLEDEDALVLTEVVTNSKIVAEHLRPNRPGSVIHHGGAALGWAGGAAVGAKLAAPGQTVVSLVGDGCSCSACRPPRSGWPAATATPALTVIYDNRGWAAPKFSTLQVHPDGAAAAAGDFGTQLRARGRPARRGAGGRRLRGHGVRPRGTAPGAQGRARHRARRPLRRDQRAAAPGLTRPATASAIRSRASLTGSMWRAG